MIGPSAQQGPGAHEPLEYGDGHAIALQGVSKWFGKLKALDEVSFFVNRGEVLCYLGPNGAGKTTTIRVISGILYPEEGSVQVLGANVPKEIQKVKPGIGLMSAEKTYFSPWYSVERILGLYGELYDVPSGVLRNRIEELLDFFELQEHRKKRVYELSMGLQTRVRLAKALIHDPELLLLDEPTASIDVEGANKIRKYIVDLANRTRKTVLLTTHNMLEAEQMASRVVIIVKGHIVADGTVDQLARTVFSIMRLEIKCESPAEMRTVLEKYGDCLQKDDTVVLSINAGASLDRILLDVASLGGVKMINMIEPTLEDIFMKVIGK